MLTKCFWFVFFQAEDGIRDYKVTGVQTCALPICNEIRGESHGLEFSGRDLPDHLAVLIVLNHLVRVPGGHQSVSVAQAQRLEVAVWISMQLLARGIDFYGIAVVLLAVKIVSAGQFAGLTKLAVHGLCRREWNL